MTPIALQKLEQIEQIKNYKNRLKVTWIFIILSIFVYLVDQYYSISYTSIFFGSDIIAVLLGLMLAIGALFLWNENRELAEERKPARYAIWILIALLTTFNGYTIYDTQKKIALEKIEQQSVIDAPEMQELKIALTQAQQRFDRLANSMHQKDDALQKLQQGNRTALKNIDDDSRNAKAKCRTNRCRSKIDRIRTNNKTSENKSFRLQLNALLKSKHSIDQSMQIEQEIITKTQQEIGLIRADFKKLKEQKTKLVIGDVKTGAMVIIIVLFDNLSLFIFFKNISRRNSLISELNRTNHRQIASKSMQIDARDLYKSPSDYKEIIETQVMLGTYRFLGQKTLSNQTNGIVSQNQSKQWHEEWAEKGWIIIPKKSNGHWNGAPYYPHDLDQHGEVFTLRAVK